MTRDELVNKQKRLISNIDNLIKHVSATTSLLQIYNIMHRISRCTNPDTHDVPDLIQHMQCMEIYFEILVTAEALETKLIHSDVKKRLIAMLEVNKHFMEKANERLVYFKA